MADDGFRREDRLVVEGQLVLESALIPEEDDRIEIGGYDLFDLISSQFSKPETIGKRERLGKFRVLVERLG